MKSNINIEVDLEEFRYSLIGDGYSKEEVEVLSPKELIRILQERIDIYVSKCYFKGLEIASY